MLIDSRTGRERHLGDLYGTDAEHALVCFILNYQSILGALVVAASVKAQRPRMRFLPAPMRVDKGEKKLLDQMKKLASSAF